MRQSRKDKILELQGQGLDAIQIANEMNRLGLKSPRGRPSTGKLVWVTIKKWREREERMKLCLKYPIVLVQSLVFHGLDKMSNFEKGL